MATIYVPDIECDSCVRRISKKLQEEKITFKIKDNEVHIDGNPHQAITIIKSLGYRAATEPFERKLISERLKEALENKKKYEVEWTGLRYAAGSFASLMALFIIAYVGFLNRIPGFLTVYGWWMFYLVISVTAIGFALWHFYAYRARFTCMSGMMVGMTFGMQTGMMLGAVLGATNGFFIGSLVGMLGGIFIGAMTGKCCGIMGIMEGLMAGIMGGTMGPMISLMMFSDHLLWFMPLYMAANIAVIFGLSYMIYEEVVEHKQVQKKPLDFITFTSLSIIATFILSIIMLYGPRAALLGNG